MKSLVASALYMVWWLLMAAVDGEACRGSMYECMDTGRCIPGYRRCDGIIDCPVRGDDEFGCVCTEGKIQCLDGGCRRRDRRCDGSFDCSYGEDELDCREHIFGFEEPQYTVTEGDGAEEVCVVVLNTSANGLLYNVSLIYESRNRTADSTDFVPVREPVSFPAGAGSPDMVRRRCFSITIVDDASRERVESFVLVLELDTADGEFITQAQVLNGSSLTEIFILDDDDDDANTPANTPANSSTRPPPPGPGAGAGPDIIIVTLLAVSIPLTILVAFFIVIVVAIIIKKRSSKFNSGINTTDDVSTVANQAYCTVDSAMRAKNAAIITGEVDTVNNKTYWTAENGPAENVYQEILN